MHVAVVDLGKTHSKLALVDTESATEIAVFREPNISNTDTTYPSLDRDAIRHFLLDALRKLATDFAIDAITVTTHGATVALLDDTGDLALPVLDYEFDGVDARAHDYAKLRPPFDDTGSPPLPAGLNVGAQLHWLKEEFPQHFASARTLLTWPQYWVFELTGELHNDLTSLGCHTDLYEPLRQRYSALVDTLQLRHLLPPTRASGQLSGTLKPAIAEQTGLPTDTPVYVGIHDSNASLVPHLLTHPAPFTVVSTGTWCITMAIDGTDAQLDAGRDTLLNVSTIGRAVPSARFMGGRERDQLGVSGDTSNEVTDHLLSREKPPLLMPSVVAGTGPYPGLRSAWINTSGELDVSERNCAVSLYLALMTYECVELVGGAGPIYVEGPFAQNTLYNAMLSTVSGRPVFRSDTQTGTSVGAAMLISPPREALQFDEVAVESLQREQLSRYARAWQTALGRHAM
ncbi:MAG: FGGY family carbohydrate kinase [Pseudomonadota bacterium]